MLDQTDLIYCLQKRFPDLVPGRDYDVAQPLEIESREPQDAVISAWWTQSVPRPTDAELQTILAQYLPLAYEAAQARRIRSDRNVRLRVADVLVNKANDLRDAERIAVAIAYRQGLRDVPGQPGFPKRVIWPEVPDAIVDLVPKSE